MNDKFDNNTELQEESNENYLTEETQHLREENKIKKCIIQTLMENQNSLLKGNKSIGGNHSEMFSMHHAQRENFITPRYYNKNYDARKGFTTDTKNQFQSLENVIEEQSNNIELNMAKETTSNTQNDPTMAVEKTAEKLPSIIDSPKIILFHLM